MAPEFDEEEGYVSSQDSDFAPDEEQGGAHDASDASEDDEADATGARADSGSNNAKRKRVTQAGDTEDAGFENSGDEAIIEKGRKRRRKGKHHAEHKGASTGAAQTEEDEDEDEGIRIKTRSQRAVEKAERKVKAASGPVTVDVDLLWAEMMNGGSKAAETSVDMQGKDAAAGMETLDADSAFKNPVPDQEGVNRGTGPANTIRIKRTYNFAGKVHTEEKVVQRDSAEAKLYLESLGQSGELPDDETKVDQDAESTPRRLPRRAFRSAFEPHIETLLPRGDLNLAVSVRLQARAAGDPANAKKLNVVEKSRMDWAGFVDKEGIKDDLVLAGKSKESFAARQDFLARSEARREDDAYRARMAAKA